MKSIGATAALVLLAGCTNTPTDLIADSKSYEGNVQSALTAQAAYRNLRDASRLCLEHSPMGTPVTVESEFDSDVRSGQITQRMIAQSVRLNLSIITIDQKPQAATEIKLYTLKGLSAVGTQRPTLDKVRRWVVGGRDC